MHQVPQQWLLWQPALKKLIRPGSREVSAAAAAHLSAEGDPSINKVWAELSYETTRQRIAPAMPQRTDCVYAFADLKEAQQFGLITGAPHDVWEGIVDDGVPWAAVDMRQFTILQPDPPSEQGYTKAWQEMSALAEHYWKPGAHIEICELLVVGGLTLTKRIERSS